MSLRQALKRSLEGVDNEPQGVLSQPPGPSKKPRVVAPTVQKPPPPSKPAPLSKPVAQAKPVAPPKPAAAPRPVPTPRTVVPKSKKAAPRPSLVAGVPQIELEEERDDADDDVAGDDADADDADSDVEAHKAVGEAAAAAEPSMPLKKRFA